MVDLAKALKKAGPLVVVGSFGAGRWLVRVVGWGVSLVGKKHVFFGRTRAFTVFSFFWGGFFGCS